MKLVDVADAARGLELVGGVVAAVVLLAVVVVAVVVVRRRRCRLDLDIGLDACALTTNDDLNLHYIDLQPTTTVPISNG